MEHKLLNFSTVYLRTFGLLPLLRGTKWRGHENRKKPDLAVFENGWLELVAPLLLFMHGPRENADAMEAGL